MKFGLYWYWDIIVDTLENTLEKLNVTSFKKTIKEGIFENCSSLSMSMMYLKLWASPFQNLQKLFKTFLKLKEYSLCNYLIKIILQNSKLQNNVWHFVRVYAKCPPVDCKFMVNHLPLYWACSFILISYLLSVSKLKFLYHYFLCRYTTVCLHTEFMCETWVGPFNLIAYFCDACNSSIL